MGELSRVGCDEGLIALWLHDRPEGTQANYRRTIRDFQRFTGKSLRDIRLEDLQAYVTDLGDRQLADSTRRNKVNAVKSLFSFAAKLQYLPFNIAAALRAKKHHATLAGRILKKEQVRAVISYHPLIHFLYGTGVRISEACGLTWDDIHQQASGQTQARIFGKGGKERIVLIPQSVYEAIATLQQPGSSIVFWHNGKPITRYDAHRIVKAAVSRAGLDGRISAHWFRHAHAQHSLAGGAPLHLLRDSLGHSSIAVTNIYLESNPEDGSSRYLDL